MLSYDKWKVLNESLGRATLGISQRPTIGGIISNVNLPPAAGKNEGWEDNELDSEEEDMGDKGVDLGSYHDEMGDDSFSSDDKMKHKGSDEEIDDMEDDDDDDDMEDDDDDDDMEDDDMGDDEEVSDEEVEEDDEDSMGDKFKMRMGSREDSMGDEEEDMEMSERPAPPMGMGETKKKTGKVLSESDWWASVKNMVGQVQPNGSIKTESLLMTMNPDDDYDAIHARAKISGQMSPIAKKFQDFLDQHENAADSLSMKGAKSALDVFVKPILEVLVKKFKKSDSNIKATIIEMLNNIRDEDQTAEAM